MPGPNPNKNNNPNNSPPRGGNNTHPQSRSAPRGDAVDPQGALASIGKSQMVDWVRSQLGVQEGSQRQKTYANALGLSADLPWCSIFIAYGLKRMGMTIPSNPAYSGSWTDYSGGKKTGKPSVDIGDLVIYDWGDGGITDHIALYIGNNQVIGGNQSNSVSKAPAKLSQAVAIVRPNYADAKPVTASSDYLSEGKDGETPSNADAETAFKATSFATYLQLPGVLDAATSISLKGERSLMNDQPLLPFIIQLTQACLRNFQSLPDGSFFAFYPDYFGGQNHRTPYWDISDIEIIEGQIQLSDDALATHVYVVGDTVGNFDGVNIEDMVQSQGVVTLFNAFLADFINPVAFEKQNLNSKDAKAKEIMNFSPLADKDNTIAFLQKYGARPHYDAAPMVRSKFYEGFLAYQTFCLLWSRQLTSNFIFTFMPEVFPGGIVRFPNHGLQMYVDEVSHTFDYATGFETHAVLIAPASTETDRSKYPIHEGMIRAGAMAAPKP